MSILISQPTCRYAVGRSNGRHHKHTADIVNGRLVETCPVEGLVHALESCASCGGSGWVYDSFLGGEDRCSCGAGHEPTTRLWLWYGFRVARAWLAGLFAGWRARRRRWLERLRPALPAPEPVQAGAFRTAGEVQPAASVARDIVTREQIAQGLRDMLNAGAVAFPNVEDSELRQLVGQPRHYREIGARLVMIDDLCDGHEGMVAAAWVRSDVQRRRNRR